MAGKHRAPSKTSKRLATVATAAAIPAVAVTGFATPEASAAPLPPDAIAHCESGGDHKAENSSSSASGKWQFIDGTWAAYGGTQFAARASGATEAQQDKVAARAYAAEGTSPWNASKSCWGGKSSKSSSVATEKKTTRKAETKPKVEKKTADKDCEDFRYQDDAQKYFDDQGYTAKNDPEGLDGKDFVDEGVPCEALPERPSDKTTAKLSIDGLTYKAPKKSVETYQALPAVTPKGQFTPGGTGPYVVKYGDTLTHLAKANNTTVDHLVNRNKNVVEHRDWIFEGERLHLR